jgi:hypothetical protein
MIKEEKQIPLYLGEEVTGYKKIRDVINSDNPNLFRKDKHFFYIIKMPMCGSSRIKIGIASNIMQRFTSYDNHFKGTQISILRLRNIPNSLVDRFGSSGKKLYQYYEMEVKVALREFSEIKNKDGTGKITEWFPQNRQTELLNKYDQFTKKDFVAEKTTKKEKSERLSAIEAIRKGFAEPKDDPFK